MPDMRPVLIEIGFATYLEEAESTGMALRIPPSLVVEALEWLASTKDCRDIRLFAPLVPCLRREHVPKALETMETLSFTSGFTHSSIEVRGFVALAPRLIEWQEFQILDKFLKKFVGWAYNF